MEYDFNQIADGSRFQRLVNAILVARFGEDAQLTPLRGPDGGSDGGTASSNPYMVFESSAQPTSSTDPLIRPPRPGRYVFQAKYHRTGEQRLSDLRARVVQEFKSELETAVLGRPDRANVNFFFLVTNVPPSKDSLAKMEDVLYSLLERNETLHADIWWGNRLTTFLDWSPSLWLSFPELFPGGTPPFLARTIGRHPEFMSRAFRLAVQEHHQKDLTVKFRQIELEQRLIDLFVDLDFDTREPASSTLRRLRRGPAALLAHRHSATAQAFEPRRSPGVPTTALKLLIDDELAVPKILLEGGPGQGKSTVTQMAAQIYRQCLLQKPEYASRDPVWFQLAKPRLPIRLELRPFAEWLRTTENGTLEQYIAQVVGQDAGGVSVAVQDLHTALEGSPVILFLDGLDEVGSDPLRDQVLDTVMATIRRLEGALAVDLRVVLTTRPPALAGRRRKLEGFTRVALAPLSSDRMDEYLDRWLHVQIKSEPDHARIRDSFRTRRKEPHVEALARNPMQLSVLLQFISLKGEAFPDRRAELYRDYFQIVIDRDVEKSPELRENRDLVEGLHSFLGFHFHGEGELDGRRRTRDRSEMVKLADHWLREEGYQEAVAEQFFALGEERFGLIVAMSGEGSQTNYGFEVQPIQEYFAASYIGNHLASGKAHGVFRRLLRRSYWREVALFLAGLRRPNEKADLIALAREEDEHDPAGLYNGRSMVVQLLREGVLHQPRHLLGQALDFVLDLLDVRSHRAQRRPEGMLATISQVGDVYSNDALRRRLTRLAQHSSDSSDEHEIEAIYRLAARFFTPQRYADLLQQYRGTASNCRALVRMTCPYGSPDTLALLAADDEYWQGVPVQVWAERLWTAAIRHAAVVDMNYPPGLHETLVAVFATSQTLGARTGWPEIDLRPSRVPAIWRLLWNLQALRRRCIGQIASNEGRGTQASASGCPPGPLNYRGLRDETKACIRSLIRASDRTLTALEDTDGPPLLADVEPYLKAIRRQARRPGLAGWVACRCAIEMLHNARVLESPIQRGRLRLAVEATLRDFYDAHERKPAPLPLRFLLRAPWLGVPDKVRLSQGKPPVPVHRVVAALIGGHLREEDREACSWVQGIPFTGAIIKALVRNTRADLSKVLRFVGRRSIVGPPGWPRLRVQDTQRILKICRETSDREILQGAATVLLHARFERIAKPILVAKLLAADPTDQFIDRAFGVSEEFLDDKDARQRYEERKLAIAVAEFVLKQPSDYPFQVVSRAVAFTAETESGPSTPLFEECPDLVAVRMN